VKADEILIDLSHRFVGVANLYVGVMGALDELLLDLKVKPEQRARFEQLVINIKNTQNLISRWRCKLTMTPEMKDEFPALFKALN